jgi:serine-threonine kinase receptor-associated protein
MVRDGVSGDWIGTLVGHKGAVWSCHMSVDACLIGTASGDYSVRVWDAVTGSPLWQWSHQHIIKTCDFSPVTARYLASGGQEGILRIYDLVRQEEEQKKQKRNVEPLEIRPVPSVAGGDGKLAIGKLNWYNEETVIVGCSDGTIRFYSILSTYSDTALHMLHTKEQAEIRDMELTTLPTQQRTLSVATGQTVYFYNVTDITTTTPPPLIQSHRLEKIHFRNEGGISLHPVSGDRFLVGGSDLYIYVHDFSTGAMLDCYKGHHGPIRCLRYAPDGTRFASGSEDGTIRLWQ